MRLGYLGEHSATGCVQSRKAPVAKRAISSYRDAMLLAPRDHVVFHSTLLQVVEHLIAGEATVAGDAPGLFEVGDVEIADAPGENFSCSL
jgi:hypothetical protein